MISDCGLQISDATEVPDRNYLVSDATLRIIRTSPGVGLQEQI